MESIMKAVAIALALCILFAAPMGTESGQQEADPADPQERLEEFVPSEEISADSAVSFPTDI
jgi:hypothetical protein